MVFCLDSNIYIIYTISQIPQNILCLTNYVTIPIIDYFDSFITKPRMMSTPLQPSHVTRPVLSLSSISGSKGSSLSGIQSIPEAGCSSAQAEERLVLIVAAMQMWYCCGTWLHVFIQHQFEDTSFPTLWLLHVKCSVVKIIDDL